MISASLKWKYLAINAWLITLGALMGWSVHSFPWGILAVAIVTTGIAAVVHRRSKTGKSR